MKKPNPHRSRSAAPARSPHLTHLTYSTHLTAFRRVTLLTLVTASATLLCGCQVLTYTGPNGERFSRSSICAITAVSSLIVEADTNGLRRVELRGYRQDSTQALAAMTAPAVRAAIQAAK